MVVPLQLFVVLVICGIILIGAEVFVPGGVLGFIGSIMLLAAIVLSFSVFGAQMGFLITVVLIAFVVVFVCLWLRIIPRTPFGRALTLSSDGKNFKSSDEPTVSLINMTGTTLCELRPSGMAKIGDERYDVITDGVFIGEGEAIKVISVEGARIVVTRN